MTPVVDILTVISSPAVNDTDPVPLAVRTPFDMLTASDVAVTTSLATLLRVIVDEPEELACPAVHVKCMLVATQATGTRHLTTAEDAPKPGAQ
jgi:hypothetical protein